MLRRKLHESLTVRIFLITLLILLGAGAITFALIAWATPITYTAAASDDLRAQTDLLVERLSVTALEDCGPILDEFIRASKSSVMLVDANGHIVQDTNSQLSIQSVYEDESTIVTVTSDSMFTASEIQSLWNGDPPAAIIQEDGREYALSIASDTQVTEVTFAGGQTCELYVSPGVRSENLAVAALARMAPWVLLVLLAFSALCAVVYSRYITRPIVRLSGIAGKMAELDFGWICGETRRDEIGALGRSLDRMSQRLSAALTDLRAANDALLGEMERERELERQRSAFFAAASHELKTPVTILKGQLTGMLDEVGVYRDRDRYLARSLQVTSRRWGRSSPSPGWNRGRVCGRKSWTSPGLWRNSWSRTGSCWISGRWTSPCPWPPASSSGAIPACWDGRWTICCPTRPCTPPPGPASGCAPCAWTGGPPWWWRTPVSRLGRRPSPACLSPSTGRSSPGTDAPAAAVWGSTW